MSSEHTAPAASSGQFELGGEATVNRLGFGAMRITGQGIWGEPRDADEARRVLRRAVGQGVNFIDTAHAYGPEVSERLIGEALYPYPDDLVVATKTGLQRPGPNQWIPDARPETIRRECERSLELLRTETIDLYQLHRPDPDVPLEESLGTIVELQTEGKVRLIGISNVNAGQLRRAQAVTEIVSVQNRANFGDRSSDDVLAACERDGIAFLPWAPLGSGDLTRAQHLEEIAKAHDATAGQVALAWLLARSPVIVPIPGTSSVEHLDENVAAAALQLTPDEVAQLG
jgi:pyridoxine 4-dehydrogenase